jgi:FtsZ-binding cell division protein ZapB
MTQSLWEPEEMAQAEEQAEDTSFEPTEEPAEEQIESSTDEIAAEQAVEPSASEPDSAEPQPVAVALSVDEFSALEDRILRAVDLVKRERTARTEAEERAAKAEALLNGQSGAVQDLQKEVEGLRAERDHVRHRVERLLAELDSLEL